jgi:hypothetical protein
MLLSKNKNCSCNGNCNCGKETQTESLNQTKELLGSFDHKIPVLETSKNNYKVVKESSVKNMLLS